MSKSTNVFFHIKYCEPVVQRIYHLSYLYTKSMLGYVLITGCSSGDTGSAAHPEKSRPTGITGIEFLVLI